MDSLITSALDGLRAAGWTVDLEAEPYPLPPVVTGRYSAIPALFAEFATCVRRCERSDECVWLLTARDYSEPPGGDGFGWDAFETMMLEPGPGDRLGDGAAARSFWQRHLPVLQAVGGDHEYLAIDTQAGTVVWGDVVDFDNPLPIAGDVADFFGQLAQVGSAGPSSGVGRSGTLGRLVHAASGDDGAKPPSGWLASFGSWFRR